MVAREVLTLMPKGKIENIPTNPSRINHVTSKFTDTDIACEVYEKKGSIEYVPSWKSWVTFKNGKWSFIDNSFVGKLILNYLSEKRSEIIEKINNISPHYVNELKNIESKLGNRSIQSIIECIKYISKTILEPIHFDADPYIVGLSDNRLINLKTLEIRESKKEDYIFKSLSTTYDPDAKCDLWEKCLNEWCQGDKELIKFLQTFAGYSMSGLTEVESFLFLYGPGANGKSKFINMITDILGDYSLAINSGSLMHKFQSSSAASGDIARWLGARLGTTTEVAEGKHFDEEMIKLVTGGGDSITARHIYEKDVTFIPKIKLIISGNHRPVIRGSDDGIWRRVCLVAFEAKIEKKDPQLEGKLKKEKAGILNWILAGWENYQKEGLIIPEIVKIKSNEYREDMDIIKHFKDECLLDYPGKGIPANDVYQLYKRWSTDNGYPTCNERTFSDKCTRHMKKKRTSKGKFYLDVVVKPPRNYDTYEDYKDITNDKNADKINVDDGDYFKDFFPA